MLSFYTFPFEMTSDTNVVGRSGTSPPKYVFLDALPTELLLTIAGYLSKTDACCLCLTTKRCLRILGPEYISPMRNHIYKDVRFLDALERDLPWNHYLCCICNKMHIYRYEQGRCRVHIHPWSSPHDNALRLLENNFRIVKRKYRHFTTIEAQDILARHATLSYGYKSFPLGFWGYLAIRPGPDGYLYLRCQSWLRWTKGMWDTAETGKDPVLDDYYMRMSYSRHGSLDATRYFTQRSFKSLTEINHMRSRQTTVLPNYPKHTKPDLPEQWICAQTSTCGNCNADIEVHVGFTRVPPSDIQRALRQRVDFKFTIRLKPESRTPKAMTTLKDLCKSSFGGKEKASKVCEPFYWCDTMVVTEWKRIGSAQPSNDVCNEVQRVDCYSPPQGLTYGYPKAQFGEDQADGYHPMNNEMHPLPIW